MEQQLSLDQQADSILERTLVEIASLFPLTDLDYQMIGYGQNVYNVRLFEGKGRNQITVVKGIMNTQPYIGSHSEEEEQEAMKDPDLQFISSWSDALQDASSRMLKPDRVVQAVTQRWSPDGKDVLILLSPDSVVRQQYIQFSPGSLFIVNLNERIAKLPIEALYPWEYYSRPLPAALQEQRPDWPHRNEVAELIKQMILQVSDLFPLTNENHELIQGAKEELGIKFAYGYWQLASAFITERGNTRTGLQQSNSGKEDNGCIGIQHDTKSGKANVDAEQAAIKKARSMYPGEPLKTIVTVHHSTANHSHGREMNLVTSCALCRKSLLKYSPNVKNIIPLNGGGIGKVPIRILYPLPDFVLSALQQDLVTA